MNWQKKHDIPLFVEKNENETYHFGCPPPPRGNSKSTPLRAFTAQAKCDTCKLGISGCRNEPERDTWRSCQSEARTAQRIWFTKEVNGKLREKFLEVHGFVQIHASEKTKTCCQADRGSTLYYLWHALSDKSVMILKSSRVLDWKDQTRVTVHCDSNFSCVPKGSSFSVAQHTIMIARPTPFSAIQ